MSDETDKHQIKRGHTVLFADNKERIVFPLTIKGLRKFVKIVDAMKNTSDMSSMTEEDINLMCEAAEVILEKVDSDLAHNRDLLEDALDLVCFNQLMSIAMGNASPEE